MKKRTRFIIITTLIVIIVGATTLIGFGYFPVARVDGGTVLYRNVTLFVGAAENFKNLPGVDPKIIEEINKNSADARRAILEELILQEIIAGGVQEFDEQEIDKKIQENVDKVLSGADREQLEQAAGRLYNMNFDDFTEMIILPEIREIVVRQSVESQGKNFDAWLEERVKNATIDIYFLPYRWNGTVLENK